MRRRDRQAPRRVEHAAAGEPVQEHAEVGVDVHESVTGPGDVVLLIGVLFRVGHEHLVANLGHVERREPAGQERVAEQERDRDVPEVAVEDVDAIVVEVCGEQEVAEWRVRQREALVDGAVDMRNVHRLGRRRNGLVPRRQVAVLAGEDEQRRLCPCLAR